MELMINILSDEFVRPSSPTKDDFKNYHLSLLDQLNPNIPIPLLLYYHHDHDQTEFIGNQIPHPLSSRLKESLSDALTMFYPFAGRLKTGESSVHCNDMGVRYLEVQVDSKIADVIEDNHEAKLLNRFIPSLIMDSEEDQDDLLLLAIQINYFNCGGIAIGASFAHRIADACTFISFMTTWATLVRKGNVKVQPSLISSSIFPQSNEKLLVEFPPDDAESQLVIRRFIFDERMISNLRAKARIDRPDMVEPSRVGVVSAFIWKCSTTTSTPGGSEKIYMLAQGVDIRARMVPPVTEHVFGNFVTPAFAISSEESDLGTRAEKIREGIEKIDNKYVRWFGLEGGYKDVMGIGAKKGEQPASKKVEIFKLSSWCRFPVYEVDFGMGKPVWVGLASHNLKNSAVLMDSKFGKGIEAWVTMTEEDLTKFQLNFTEANNAC